MRLDDIRLERLKRPIYDGANGGAPASKGLLGKAMQRDACPDWPIVNDFPKLKSFQGVIHPKLEHLSLEGIEDMIIGDIHTLLKRVTGLICFGFHPRNDKHSGFFTPSHLAGTISDHARDSLEDLSIY